MNNEEKILEMLVAMRGDIQNINHRLDSMERRMDSLEQRMDSLEQKVDSLDKRVTVIETKLDDLIEAHEETRTSVNILIDWAVRASSVLKFPLPKIV